MNEAGGHMIRLARQFLSRSRPPVSAGVKPAVSLHELLGRPAVNLDTPEMQRFLAGKRVMVTGAGGSIGSEICRQTMRFCPQRMVLLERAENSLFEIDRELRQRWIGADLRPHLADIVDAERIAQIFDAERPQVIFHCAAHKHVPMTEINPCEAIRNNVLGTKVVADAAGMVDAQAFVMVSSDKAVNPTSVMGATKRVAELYVQSLNAGIEDRESTIEDRKDDLSRSSLLDSRFSTRFTAVRFGNVLGSSGSVIPIFQKQIEAGGPVTVTHADMKRYFMTIPEASQLVMQAGAIGQGGEIFVLDMGEPIRILDLAKELIARNGLKLGQDIDIQITGIRPGEKLYEELSCEDESIVATPHEKIHVWHLPPANRGVISQSLELLTSVVYGQPTSAVQALMSVVPEYRPAGFESSEPALRLIPAAIRAA
jgi:FlaA1/EpsC-like NDP-sugar epimerase